MPGLCLFVLICPAPAAGVRQRDESRFAPFTDSYSSRQTRSQRTPIVGSDMAIFTITRRPYHFHCPCPSRQRCWQWHQSVDSTRLEPNQPAHCSQQRAGKGTPPIEYASALPQTMHVRYQRHLESIIWLFTIPWRSQDEYLTLHVVPTPSGLLPLPSSSHHPVRCEGGSNPRRYLASHRC